MSATRNLRETLAIAQRIGCDVWRARRTGELVFEHPAGRVRVNARRKDEARVLRVLMKRAAPVSTPEPPEADREAIREARKVVRMARAIYGEPWLPAPRWRQIVRQLSATGDALGYDDLEELLESEVHPNAASFLRRIDRVER